MAKIKRAVIYARYSSDKQTEQSIEGQMRVCEEYAQKNDLAVVGSYIDRAVSAKTDKRPEFQQLIKDSHKNLFEAVIVYKTDRFARNKYDSALYKKLLRELGIELHYAAETIPKGPEGVILESLMEGLAEYYSLELAQKVKRGMRESAYKCQATGIRPFGYEVLPDKTFQPHPEEAPIVRLIFQRLLEGKTYASIIREANGLGYRTTRGKKFSQNVIKRILEAERYRGVYIFGDIRIEDGMPRLIDDETFYLVQKELKKRQKAKRKKREPGAYLLSGKVFCGECGKPLHGCSGTSKSGKTYRYYRCSNKTCELRPVQASRIEPYITKSIQEYVLLPEVSEELLNALWELQEQDNEIDEELWAYQLKLKDLEKRKANILAAIETGVDTTSLPLRLKELDGEIRTLNQEIRVLEGSNFRLSKEQLSFWLEHHMKNADSKKILADFIQSITVRKDQIILTFTLTRAPREPSVRGESHMVTLRGIEPLIPP